MRLLTACALVAAVATVGAYQQLRVPSCPCDSIAPCYDRSAYAFAWDTVEQGAHCRKRDKTGACPLGTHYGCFDAMVPNTKRDGFQKYCSCEAHGCNTTLATPEDNPCNNNPKAVVRAASQVLSSVTKVGR